MSASALGNKPITSSGLDTASAAADPSSFVMTGRSTSGVTRGPVAGTCSPRCGVVVDWAEAAISSRCSLAEAVRSPASLKDCPSIESCRFCTDGAPFVVSSPGSEVSACRSRLAAATFSSRRSLPADPTASPGFEVSALVESRRLFSLMVTSMGGLRARKDCFDFGRRDNGKYASKEQNQGEEQPKGAGKNPEIDQSRAVDS